MSVTYYLSYKYTLVVKIYIENILYMYRQQYLYTVLRENIDLIILNLSNIISVTIMQIERKHFTLRHRLNDHSSYIL